MLQEVVACEECGREGSKDEIGICGDCLKTPESGYGCIDIICPNCLLKDRER